MHKFGRYFFKVMCIQYRSITNQKDLGSYHFDYCLYIQKVLVAMGL